MKTNTLGAFFVKMRGVEGIFEQVLSWQRLFFQMKGLVTISISMKRM